MCIRDSSNTAEQQRKTVAAQDGEDDPHRSAARFSADISSDLLQRRIIALCASQNRLCNADHVAVAQRKALALCGLDD